ncbi:MAG: MipA/OmpV family protein [Pseudomonadota bacterium]
MSHAALRHSRLVKATLSWALFTGASLALAQAPADRPAGASPGRPPVQTGWQTDLGAAIIANPRFQGSDDYQLLPVPYFDVRYNDRKGNLLFANVPQGLGGYFLRVVDSGGRRLAASASIAPGFANRDPDDLEGLETFGTAIEARMQLEYGTRRFGIQASVAQALGTGHEGFYADLGASWRTRVGQRGFLSLGPNIRWGNDQFLGALYGVSEAEATATGLGAFDAGSGVERIGLQGVLSLPVNDRWRWTTVAQVGRLLGDAGDSSLTDSKTQAFVLMALTRRF